MIESFDYKLYLDLSNILTNILTNHLGEVVDSFLELFYDVVNVAKVSSYEDLEALESGVYVKKLFVTSCATNIEKIVVTLEAKDSTVETLIFAPSIFKKLRRDLRENRTANVEYADYWIEIQIGVGYVPQGHRGRPRIQLPEPILQQLRQNLLRGMRYWDLSDWLFFQSEGRYDLWPSTIYRLLRRRFADLAAGPHWGKTRRNY